MHHFIFSHKDSFIYSEEVARARNFGLDKFVEVGCINKLSRTYRTSSLALTSLAIETVNRYVTNFNGNFTGSICFATASVSGSVNCNGYLSPGGICAPRGIVDEFGNIVDLGNGDLAALSLDEDFFVFP